jgi:hypothetical protein
MLHLTQSGQAFLRVGLAGEALRTVAAAAFNVPRQEPLDKGQQFS